MTFTGVLQSIGKGFEKGLQWAAIYAVPAEKLAVLLFPAAAPATAVMSDVTSLIQTSVLLVEQKFSAAGMQSGTGAQKMVEVLLLAGPAATQLMSQAGISASTLYLQSLVSAVVAILNVQPMPVTASTASTTA